MRTLDPLPEWVGHIDRLRGRISATALGGFAEHHVVVGRLCELLESSDIPITDLWEWVNERDPRYRLDERGKWERFWSRILQEEVAVPPLLLSEQLDAALTENGFVRVYLPPNLHQFCAEAWNWDHADLPSEISMSCREFKQIRSGWFAVLNFGVSPKEARRRLAQNLGLRDDDVRTSLSMFDWKSFRMRASQVLGVQSARDITLPRIAEWGVLSAILPIQDGLPLDQPLLEWVEGRPARMPSEVYRYAACFIDMQPRAYLPPPNEVHYARLMIRL